MRTHLFIWINNTHICILFIWPIFSLARPDPPEFSLGKYLWIAKARCFTGWMPLMMPNHRISVILHWRQPGHMVTKWINRHLNAKHSVLWFPKFLNIDILSFLQWKCNEYQHIVSLGSDITLLPSAPHLPDTLTMWGNTEACIIISQFSIQVTRCFAFGRFLSRIMTNH